MKETILAIAAHNDDHLIGAGGTLAKYAAEGKVIKTVICSFGEKSHPHLRKEIIVRRRVAESLKADRIMLSVISQKSLLNLSRRKSLLRFSRMVLMIFILTIVRLTS